MERHRRLHRNSLKQLVFTALDGEEQIGISAVRAFPISAGREHIALLSREGHEVEWIPCLDDLDEETRLLVEEELASSDFVPEILRVRSVSGYATPCTWQVETNRGDTSLVLKSEEDIRRLMGPTLLIMDGCGIQFLVRDPAALDATSRKILDRFV